MSPATTATLPSHPRRARVETRARASRARCPARPPRRVPASSRLTLCHAGPAPSSRTERIAPGARAAHRRGTPPPRRNPKPERELVQLGIGVDGRGDGVGFGSAPSSVAATNRPERLARTRPAAAAPTASAEASDRARTTRAPPTGGARRLVASSDATRAPREPRAAAVAARDIDESARVDTARSIASAGLVSVRARAGVMTVAVEVPAPALVLHSLSDRYFSSFCATSFALLENARFTIWRAISRDWLLCDHLNFFPRPSRRLEFLGFAFSHDATATTLSASAGRREPFLAKDPAREVPAAHTFAACLRFPAGRHVRVRRADARRASRRAARADARPPPSRMRARAHVGGSRRTLLGRADARPRRRRRRARGRATRASCVAAPARARGLRAGRCFARARRDVTARVSAAPRGRRPRRRARSRWTARAWAGTRRSSTR